MPIPRPPINSMADFVVFAFVGICVMLLLLVGVGAIVWVFVDPDADITGILIGLSDIVGALISALVGFLAGRGQGRVETHQEYADIVGKRRKEEE